ncbi:MAG: hypothetical protein WAV46_03805 [Candidatus Moraniibacteriota bacterium]
MKTLIKLNVVFFVLYFLFQWFDGLESFLVFRILRSFIELIAILVLGGLNIAAIVQLFFKYNFDLWEMLSLSSVTSLLFVPLLLTIEFSQFHILFKSLPAANSFFIFLILAMSCYLKRGDFANRFQFAVDKPRGSITNAIVSSPLFWVFILNISITFIIFSAYYALPDLDPFYWIQRYAKDFDNGVIVQLMADRPIFSSLLYFLNQGANIDLYASFKYVLPLLSILTLIPAWLIARKFPSKLLQTIILLLPLTSSSTILYSQTPIPQAISIISIYYFFFFLIYSWLFNKNIFYYLAGITAFLGFFYHEMAAIIFAVWLLVTLIFNRKFILEAILKNKLITLLIALLITSNAYFLKNQLDFILHWTEMVMQSIFVMKLNFLFPAYYINMNGQSMGWGDTVGVLKYYIYYAGPAILILLFAFVYFVIRNDEFRKLTINLRRRREIIVLSVCFLIFFSISEVLPRLSNVALLPDRSWVFTGIFSLALFFIITKIGTRKIKIISMMILLGIVTSIGGALYINGMKQYMITNEKLSSAEWIRSNLPNNRILFTDMDGNLLQYYGNSKIQIVPTDFYYDINIALTEINNFKINRESLENNYSLFIKTSKQNLEELSNKNLQEQRDSILVLLDDNIQESTALASLLRIGKIDPENQKKLYIYYSKANEKNPYLNRPYYIENMQGTRKLIFDQYPDKFQRVYEDTADNIVIWKIL